MAMQRLPEEVAELQRHVSEHPDDLEVRDALADALFELGHTTAALDQLYATAERLEHQRELADAIDFLNRLLAVEPNHEDARRLRAKLYCDVPRQADSRTTGLPGVSEQSFVARLFALPESSADVLSQILPFDDEDPQPVPGPAVVPLPPGATEPPRPFLAALDRELKRGESLAPEAALAADDTSPLPDGEVSSVPGEVDQEEELDEAFRAGLETLKTRISPASKRLTVDGLPPNPVIDLLDRQRLARLLDLVDLLCFEVDEVVLDSWTKTRSLYVLVRGKLKVQREVEEVGLRTIDVLQPGDFFGEFEFLTLAATHAQLVAAETTSALEIPESLVGQLVKERPEVLQILWNAYFQRSFHSMMATSPIFSVLPMEVISRIACDLEPLVFETGDIVLREGELPRGLYGVVGGSLATTRPSQHASEILTRLGPGDFFGLMSSTSGEPSRASVVATEDTTLLWLPFEAMESLRQTLPEFERILNDASQSRIWRYKLTAPG